jgi:hypothetical protein
VDNDPRNQSKCRAKVVKRAWLLILGLSACDGDVDALIEGIEKGTVRSEVVELLGEPDDVTPCEGNLWWGTKFISPPDGHWCVTTLWYGWSDVSRWSIGLDKNGKVISKYKYVSP